MLIDGRETQPNPNLPDQVWDAWRQIPTHLLPQRGVRPVSRLLQLATSLARDGINPGAHRAAVQEVMRELEAQLVRRPERIEQAKREVLTIHGMSIAGVTGETHLRYDEFEMAADDQAILYAYREAGKAFGDVAGAYVDKHGSDGDDFDDPLRNAMVEIAALATVPEVRAAVDGVANELFKVWDITYWEQISRLPDLRRTDYREIKAQAPDPQVESLIRPRVRLEDFKKLDGEKPVDADLVDRHLMSDEHGKFPISSLNDWEQLVLDEELARETTVAWYRNPPRSAGDSICIAYRDEFGNWRGTYPDFIMFDQVGAAVRPSIVDPHSYDLPDAMRKLKALARFAKEHGDKFERIESVVVSARKIRRLDLKSQRARERVEVAAYEGDDALGLYPLPVGSVEIGERWR